MPARINCINRSLTRIELNGKEVMKMKRPYNPYLLPPWLRKTRFYCRQIILPVVVFQAIRTLFLPTTLDIILLCLLSVIAYLLLTDFI